MISFKDQLSKRCEGSDAGTPSGGGEPSQECLHSRTNSWEVFSLWIFGYFQKKLR